MASFNASIGVLGHEFSHIVDYESRNVFGIIKRTLDYTTQKSKTKYEKEIDLITINHGLGWQLYEWSYFAIYNSKASNKYKEFKKRTYMTPKEIEKIIKKL